MKVPVLLTAAIVACLIFLLIGWQYLPHTQAGERQAEARQMRHDAIAAAMDGQNVKACELYKVALRDRVTFDSSESDILERACAKAALGIR